MHDLNAAYKILGINSTTPMSEIKRNYRELARIYHPDNQDTGNATKMKLLNDAFDTVKSIKPAADRNVKTAPKRETGSRFNGKNRIYRILSKKGSDGVYSIKFPFDRLDDKTVFHFMIGTEEINLFIDKEIMLPTLLNVTYKNRSILVRVSEGFD